MNDSTEKTDLYSLAQEKFETEICNNMELIELKNSDILKSIDNLIQNHNPSEENNQLNDKNSHSPYDLINFKGK